MFVADMKDEMQIAMILCVADITLSVCVTPSLVTWGLEIAAFHFHHCGARYR